MSPTHPMFPGEPPLSAPILTQRDPIMTDIADHIAAHICRTIGQAHAARPYVSAADLATDGTTAAMAAQAARDRRDVDGAAEALVAVARAAIEGAWRTAMGATFVADRVEHIDDTIGIRIADLIFRNSRLGTGAVLALHQEHAPFEDIAAVALDTAATYAPWATVLATLDEAAA